MDNLAFINSESGKQLPEKRMKLKRASTSHELKPIKNDARNKRKTFRISFHRNNFDEPSGSKNSIESKYMDIGPPPPEEFIPKTFESFETVDSLESFYTPLSIEFIKNSLKEQAKLADVKFSTLDEMLLPDFTHDRISELLESASQTEKNVYLLWTAFNKKSNLLAAIYRSGVDVHYCDSNGLTAIHLSAFSGCVASTIYLIFQGANVNNIYKYFSPLHCAAFGNQPKTASILIDNGAILSTNTKNPNWEESVLHCAIRANAAECVNVLVNKDADVNYIAPSGSNPIQLAADLGMPKCLAALLKSQNVKINLTTKDTNLTALHLAAEEGNLECVKLLLDKGADVTLKTNRGHTALHLAARSSCLECVEALLVQGNADPNTEDDDKRTSLHAAIGKFPTANPILELLIEWGANINHKDIYGFTPLHLAALDGLSHCVETLIYHGADVTTRANEGNSALNVITRKSPVSIAMIYQKLNSSITLHNTQESSSREIELEFDFRNIFQYSHPKEISYLKTFVEEGQKEILEHPLCSAFLYLKWGKVRKLYISRLLFWFIFIVLFTVYVRLAFPSTVDEEIMTTDVGTSMYGGECQIENGINSFTCTYTKKEDEAKKPVEISNNSMPDNLAKNILWGFLAALTILEMFRKMHGIVGYWSMNQYFTQPENIIEWFVYLSVFLIAHVYTGTTETWQHHIAAFAILAGWTNLMLRIGQLPVLGSYVAMYLKVQKEFAKLFLAYFCVILGFTFSFSILYPSDSFFSNPLRGIIILLTMMVGELSTDYLNYDKPYVSVSAEIIFALCVMFVTIVLMNLLVGIAVQDIQGLKKTATLSRLVRQTKLISHMEMTLFNERFPSYVLRFLRKIALVSPQAYRVVLRVKPLNPSEKRLPQHIMMAAYEIAKKGKNFARTIKHKESTVTYWSFRKFENHDNHDLDSDVRALRTEVSESAKRIKSLTSEVKELKQIIQHLIDVLPQK